MTTLKIDPTEATPPFEQLRRQLIDQIMSRRLPAGTKLPSVRRLAADLTLAPGTVARAYRELEIEGYLITKGRGGTFVAPIAAASASAQKEAETLASNYVSTMRQLGFGPDAILGEARRALG